MNNHRCLNFTVWPNWLPCFIWGWSFDFPDLVRNSPYDLLSTHCHEKLVGECGAIWRWLIPTDAHVNSHHLLFSLCIDIVGRSCILVTSGSQRFDSLAHKDCKKISVRYIIFQFSILFRFLHYEQLSKFSLVGSSSMVRHTTISWSET